MAVMTMFKQHLNHLLVNKLIRWLKRSSNGWLVKLNFRFLNNLLFLFSSQAQKPFCETEFSFWSLKVLCSCYLWSHFFCLLLPPSTVLVSRSFPMFCPGFWIFSSGFYSYRTSLSLVTLFQSASFDGQSLF